MDQDHAFMSILVAKLEETRLRSYRRGVSYIDDLFLEFSTSSSKFKGHHINDYKGQPSKSSRAAVIFSFREPSSLSLGGLLGVPTCINKKASSLSRLAIS